MHVTQHYTIITAALVALVAIGGMVMVLNPPGGALGAFHQNSGEWKTGSDPRYYQLGDQQAGPTCNTLTSAQSGNEWRKCCADQCASLCNSMGFSDDLKTYWFSDEPNKECGKGCIQGCTYHTIRTQSIGFNYRGDRTSPTE